MVGRWIERARTAGRWAAAVGMAVAGVGHFVATEAFLGQTPDVLPFRRAIVLVSGAVELGLAAALVLLPKHRRLVGRLLALFLVAVFPGNVYQAITGTSTFGLDTPAERWGRLLLQPIFIAAALWVTSDGRYHRENRSTADRAAEEGPTE